MQDLEDRLRELSDRVAREVPLELSPTPRARRRIRVGRAVRSGAVLATVAALVIGGFAGARSLSSDEALPPANPRPEGIFADVGGWIAYRSGSEIRAVDPTKPTGTIVIGPSLEADPIAWSQDGSRLLLRPHPEESPIWNDGQWNIGTLYPESPLDLFVLDSDGSRKRLTRGNGGEVSGTWGSFSPDGSEVVYASSGGGPGPWIIDADGGQPREMRGVHKSPDGEPFSEWAAWSPDGSRIAFVDFWEDHAVYGDHAHTLSFVDPDTGDTLGEVVNIGAAGPVWSPDGSQLAFSADPDEDVDPPNGDPDQIFVINANGSGLRQITHTGDNRWPTWSPDGSRIAFARGQLTFTPDGSQAYVQAGSRQLFTMAPDGADVRIVEGVEPDGPIAWNPLP